MMRRRLVLLVVTVSIVACRQILNVSPPTPTSTPGAISGQVIDAVTGDPITGANVITDPPTSSVTTDADGSYTIGNMPPGKYTVTATSGADARAYVQVAVAAGRTTATDLHLRRKPPPYWLAEDGVTRNADWTPHTEEKNGALMALVPQGCFMMGSEDGEDGEKPVHQVCFEEPFWIDVYEVTNRQYGSRGCENYSSNPDQPRNCINWTDARAHCQARGVRLPTEAEWEYAARGPDALVFPWGNEFIADNVVYGANSETHTWEVGSKPGGVAWIGAYDLSGNVWEWVADWYGDYPSGQQVNPAGPESGEYHILRGGSWGHVNPYVLRAAFRFGIDMDFQGDFLGGFRCALSYY